MTPSKIEEILEELRGCNCPEPKGCECANATKQAKTAIQEYYLSLVPENKEEYTSDYNLTHGGYSHTEDGKRWFDLEFNQGHNSCRDLMVRKIRGEA